MNSTPTPQKPPQLWQKIGLPVALVLGLAFGGWALYQASTTEITDDAYLNGHIHEVSARVAGVVKEVLVKDNQYVEAGDPLVRLDPTDNQAVYDEAKANFDKVQADDARNQEMSGTKAVTQQDLDHAHSDRQAAQARLETARLQLAYTTIVAPASGRVGRKNVEIGNHVQAGESLLVIVEKEVWVVANFKETQLARIKVGQKVTMTVDALPGKTFLGQVDSLAPASGNQFALLPADNATGNFTKIVQRLPIKITFNPNSVQPYLDRLSPGLSVIAKVNCQNQQ